MSTLTSYMNLTAWTSTSDPYAHTELASNWALIDSHNHTSGKGPQIPTGGIADHAVTTIKLALLSVGTAQLIDASVTAAKLDPAALGSATPMGQVIHIWRPTGSTAQVWGAGRSSGKAFELCDGRTIIQADHDLGVTGSVVLPNLIDRFVLGGIAANVGVTGGSASVNLSHSHTVNAHSHVVNAHHHQVLSHAHGVGSDGVHSHTYNGGRPVHTRRNAPVTHDSGGLALQFRDIATNARSFQFESLYIAGLNSFPDSFGDWDLAATMDGAGGHSHGGATGSANPDTTDVAPGTDAVTVGTNAQLGGSVNTLPPSMTLIPIVRVRLG